MLPNNIMLEINNVSKKIKKKTLLYPINYTLNKGKILALCGGNGAGKSTLIRLITRIHKPSTGKVIMNQYNENKHNKPDVKPFGYMPDNFTFQHSLTAKEIMSFYARIKNISKQKYEEVLHEVGLLDKQNVKVGTFSKGMAQRLLLGQALLNEPSLLILDEPTNGLDPYWIQQFCKLLLKAKKNGQTVIFSTHDLHVAEKIADEVIFLHNGRVMSKGPISKYREMGLYETFQQIYFNSFQKQEQT